jgi:hypothetical protein
MASPNAARAAPGVSGNGSQKKDRQDGAISPPNKASAVAHQATGLLDRDDAAITARAEYAPSGGTGAS